MGDSLPSDSRSKFHGDFDNEPAGRESLVAESAWDFDNAAPGEAAISSAYRRGGRPHVGAGDRE
jgi:hypothetical protein